MAEVRLTKVALKECQNKLAQLRKYLPTLKLKKSLLQSEVSLAEVEEEEAFEQKEHRFAEVFEFAEIFSVGQNALLQEALEINQIHKKAENIAGIEVEALEKIEFVETNFKIIDTPFWFEEVLALMQKALTAKWAHYFAKEKKRRLQEELRNVTIRVNLFEKVLIPKTLDQINKIKIFLGDLMLGDIAKAKIAKKKIELSRDEQERGKR